MSTSTRSLPERLPARDRREQLLRTAADLLRREGTDGLELTRLAAEAGVSRPIVYRFFPSRQALIVALLEDLEQDITRRLDDVAKHRLSASASLEDAARLFVEASCDTIEDKGVGPWELLASKGPDPAVARVARKIHARLLAPWHTHVANALGLGRKDAETVSRMLVAAARAALEEWYAGNRSRADAVKNATRAVGALLEAFADGPKGATGPARGA
jgi:AcrR family transcriptional regulator